LTPQHFEEPRLSAATAGDLPVSGEELLDLMRAVLARGVPFRFHARGWSMAPFVRDGDAITVSPLPQNPPGVGDVVAFVRPGTRDLVVHRVVARHGRDLLIQGDSVAQSADGIIPAENLLGRVTRVERDGRDIRLGSGPERIAIAWLSRKRLLIPLCVRLPSRLKALFRPRR